METLELIPEVVAPPDSELRTYTASTKLTAAEHLALARKAAYSGRKPSEWVRHVILRELNSQDLPDIVLSELLGVRMILLNLLGAFVRGEKISMEQLQKTIAQIDAQKMNRALEKIREIHVSQNGGK